MIRAVLALTLGLSGTAEAAFAPGVARLAGFYSLEGLQEVGSELLLRGDGTYEFVLAYGAVDQAGRGCWRLSDSGAVMLLAPGRRTIPTDASPADRRFRGLGLVLMPDGSLLWPLEGVDGVAYVRRR
jgi:hypothetical protein